MVQGKAVGGGGDKGKLQGGYRKGRRGNGGYVAIMGTGEGAFGEGAYIDVMGRGKEREKRESGFTRTL